MKSITVPTREQVSTQSQEIFDVLTKKIGKVPNLYATIGYSGTTLKAVLEFDGALSQSVFSAKEREAVNLVVSQVNNCAYCLAAHTFIAGKLGVPADEIMLFRKGVASDSKLNAAVQLAKAIAENKGNVAENLKQAFFDAGYDEAMLMDLIGLVSIRTYTNYVYALTQIPVDFPAAEEL